MRDIFESIKNERLEVDQAPKEVRARNRSSSLQVQ